MGIVELGAIGELVGGVAVIGSLLYLSLQVRQSNDQARQGNAIELNASMRSTSSHHAALLLQLKDVTFSNTFRRALHDFDALDGDEKLQVTAWLSAYTAHTGTTLSSSNAGFLDPSVAEVTLGFLAGLVGTPGGRQWWKVSKPFFPSWLGEAIEAAATGHNGVPAITEAVPWWASDASESPRGA